MAKGFRIYNGRDFQKVGSGNVRIWDGGNWQHGKARAWDGHNWINLLEERHVTTWEATNSCGYWGADHGRLSHNHYNSLWKANHPLQGNYRPYHDGFNNQAEGGMIWFDDGNIRAQLAGARIERVEVFLYAVHSAYYNGGEAVIGTHNARGYRDRFEEANHSVATARFWGRNQGQWITLPNWVGDNFRDNLLSGITTFGNASLWQYIVYAGSNDGWKKPKLRITYVK